MSLFDRACMTSYSTLVETMHLSCTVFKLPYNKLSKVTYFNLPHLHLAPPLGVTAYEFHRDLWHMKTRILALSCSIICVILGLAIILLKQDTVSGTGITWAIRKSAPRFRHASFPPFTFLQAGCPSCCPINCVKALKALFFSFYYTIY